MSMSRLSQDVPLDALRHPMYAHTHTHTHTTVLLLLPSL